MLSIRLGSNTEWWVSGSSLARLFQMALRDGFMSAELGKWLDVADANGGLDVSQIAPSEGAKLIAALRSAAECDVKRLLKMPETREDGSYRVSLQKFLALEKPKAFT